MYFGESDDVSIYNPKPDISSTTKRYITVFNNCFTFKNIQYLNKKTCKNSKRNINQILSLSLSLLLTTVPYQYICQSLC